MQLRRTLALPLCLLALLVGPLPACGDDEDAEADKPAEEGEGEAEDEGGEEAGEEGGAVAETKRSMAALTGLERFKHWSPRHAFLKAPVVAGSVISEDEAIAATKDGQVGVSTDGGESWTWTAAGDRVVDVAGYPGGPYVQLHEGSMSISDDGLIWRRLPRHTEDTLIDVVAAEVGLIAIGKRGAWVHFKKDGSAGAGGQLPDNFKAKAITELNSAVLAWSGKRGYGTADGESWTELETLPPLPDGRDFLTSAGSCSIGRVDRGKGVVCSVTGTAYGVGEEFVVDSRGVVSLTTDGGETWVTSRLPFKGANSIFGTPGGPYYAVGNSGAVAISKDGGATWVDQKWQESANLLDGVVDGDTVIIVGAKGTLIYSKDGAKKWEYAQPPVGKNLNWVAKVGDRFVASDGRAFIASANGSEWLETEAIELPGSPGPCGDEGPADGEACRYDADVTSPEGIPDVRSLTFEGDVGLAMGDDGLVALTQDGGASWTETHGLELGRSGATAFSVRGQELVATNGSRLVVSSDGGASWTEAEFAGKPRFSDVLIASEFRVAAAKGELLVSSVDPKLWISAEGEDLGKSWIVLYEVAGAVYAADGRGELVRSEDGETWTRVITGVSTGIVSMAGEGDSVWAASEAGRRSDPQLLRSEDGGAHFIHVGPGPTRSPELHFEDGAIHWRGLVSKDLGTSWRPTEAAFHGGAVEVRDGSGMKLANYTSRYVRDELVVIIGEGAKDVVRIETAPNEGGVLECDADSGCWMLADGVLYRPLGK